MNAHEELYVGAREEPEPTVGEILIAAREQTGVTLRDAATALRIRYAYLDALESGRHEALPGSAYALGFLRTYSIYLGLDPEAMIRRFKQEAAGVTAKRDYVFPAPEPETRVPGGAIIAVALLLAVAAYGGWYYFATADRGDAVATTELPERFAAMLEDGPDDLETSSASSVSASPEAGRVAAIRPEGAEEQGRGSSDVRSADLTTPDRPEEPASVGGIAAAPERLVVREISRLEAAAEEPPAEAEVADDALAAEIPGDGQNTEQNSAPPVLVEQVEADASETNESLAADAPAAGPGRIVLQATADSWVLIRDASEAMVMTRVMQAGETYEVPDQAGLTMVTGNAGGLDILVDGVTVPPLGGPGAVVRDVSLDAESLRGGNVAGNL